jgi:hypothetical protein
MEFDIKESSLFKELFADQSVNESLKLPAFDLLNSYLSKESSELLNSVSLKLLGNFSLLCISRLHAEKCLNFSHVFESEFSNWKAHSSVLHRFLAFSSLPDWIRDEMTQLIESVQVSQNLFYRLGLVWKKVTIKGNFELICQIKEASWLLFISTRSGLLNRTNSITDCMFLLMGTLAFTIQRLPSYLSAQPQASEIIRQHFQASETEFVFWTDKIKEFANDVLLRSGITVKNEDFMGIFSRKYLKGNLEALQTFYKKALDPQCFDERVFQFEHSDRNRETVKMPLARRHISGKVLNYESDFYDRNDLNWPITQNPVTLYSPLTMSMDMHKWVTDVTLEAFPLRNSLRPENVVVEQSEELQEMFERMLVARNIQHEAHHILLCVENEIFEVKLLYLFNALYKKLTTVKVTESQSSIPTKDCLSCLFVLCVEIFFYTKNIIVISFADILEAFHCAGFTFFQLIPYFSSIPSMPAHFKLHLLQIEKKILLHIAWKADSSIHKTIEEYIANSNGEPLQDNFNRYKGLFPEEYEVFFDKLITEVGLRVDALCKSCKIEENAKEKIWNTLKYVLSEKTEILFGRHVSLFIICSVYAVCKFLVLGIKFKNIIEEYWKIYEEEEGIFVNLKLKNGKTVEIVEFYNTEFIRHVREFIDLSTSPIRPRVAVLSPISSLAEQINGAVQQKKSPFATPRTKSLFASPNSGKNSPFKPIALSFDNPDSHKVPEFIKALLSQPNEVDMPVPIIKKQL